MRWNWPEQGVCQEQKDQDTLWVMSPETWDRDQDRDSDTGTELENGRFKLQL